MTLRINNRTESLRTCTSQCGDSYILCLRINSPATKPLQNPLLCSFEIRSQLPTYARFVEETTISPDCMITKLVVLGIQG